MPGKDGNFADRLFRAVQRKNSLLCVGLDPRWDLLPPHFLRKVTGGELSREGLAAAYRAFGEAILEEVAPYVAAVKFQVACYEALGAPGWEVLEEAIGLARSLDLVVIMDAKRGDIASTAEMYAQAYLGGRPVPSGVAGDAVTVLPYLGRDGLLPFIAQAGAAGRGVFVVVRSSNPSAGDIQDLATGEGPVYARVAALVRELAAPHRGELGYSAVGAVVGATRPQELPELRRQLPHVPLLIPGIGTQGGRVEDLRPALDEHGLGAVVVAARSIIYAWRQAGEEREDFAGAAARAAAALQEELNRLRGA